MLRANLQDRRGIVAGQDRVFTGWGPIDVYPGDNLCARIHGTPGTNRVFRLMEGVHELWAPWDVDVPCTVTSDGLAVVRLMDHAHIQVTANDATLAGFTVESEPTGGHAHHWHMVHVSAQYVNVHQLSFRYANEHVIGAGTYYPLYLDDAAMRCSVRDNDFYNVETFLAALRQIYVEDASAYNAIVGNRLSRWKFGRNLISALTNVDNEAGYDWTAGPGTANSRCNFADVELR